MLLCHNPHGAAINIKSIKRRFTLYQIAKCMDHLPYPDNAFYPQIQIPYLATEAIAKYHGDNFVDFPIQVGWKEGDGNWFDCEPSIAAARAQSWLFFGLLKEVVGPTFSEPDFIARDGEHKDFVSTKTGLPPLLEKRFGSKELLFRLMFIAPPHFIFILILSLGTILFKAEFRHRISGAAQKRRSKTRAAMIEAEHEVRSIEAAFPDSNDVHLVCLSIRAFLWSLRNALAEQDFTILRKSSLELSSSPYLKSLLIERGMCPHYLATIDERSSVATMHYLAGIYRPAETHRDCTSQFCCANILDPVKYETKHVDDDCDCDFIKPDIAEIRRAIDVGDVPVIRASLREGAVNLATERAAFDIPYVAISHVWSGGLGNQQTSSLPACQIRRICHLLKPLMQPSVGETKTKWHEMIKMGRSRSEKDAEQGADLFLATDSCVFWMDTLCLPKQKAQRDLAIGQMTRIYAGAQQVVVLDKGLQKIGAETQEEEILANLVSSSWMSRCWTFQEGRLAQQLLIDVDQSLRDPFVIYNQAATQAAMFRVLGLGLEKWNDKFQLRREMASVLYRMRPLKDERIRSTDFSNFVDVWNELVRRTTSWPEDVTTILTLMLDLSVNEVKSISGENERLKAILRTQEALPLSFLLTDTESIRGSNDELWMPTNLTKTVDMNFGGMEKMMDIGIGEPGFALNSTSDALVLMKSNSRPSGRFLGIWSSEDGDERQDYTISLTLPEAVLLEAASNESTATASTNDLYLFHVPHLLTEELSSYSGRGCRFKIVKEESTYMAVTYDCSFSYTWELVTEVMDATERDGALEQLIEPIIREIRVRMKCDWRQWPSLQYHRSRTVKRMTTTHKPTHPYAFCLFNLELILGTLAVVCILVTFPSKASNGVEPLATDWVAYAACLVILSGRLLYVLFKECPTLNRLLKLTEYQKWTESFAEPAGNADGNLSQSSAIKPYQYRPWWVTVGFTCLGIGLLATGVIVNGANLFEITIAGGYLVGVHLLLAFTEAFWRFPGMPTLKQKLLDRLFGKYPTGFDSYNVFKLSSLKKIKKAILEPGDIHGKANLDCAFGEPLYLPEAYKRWR